jgi:putative transposase
VTITTGHRALRTGRVSSPGQVYLVTAVVAGRAPVFHDWDAACTASRIAASGVAGSHFLAWVLMPNHFHGLLILDERATLSETMRLFKGSVAFEVNRALRRTGPLWQAAFHDHALRKEEDLENIARYIIENPVRARLVDRVGDYPFWNAQWL